jgi:hypothetical protein
MQHAQKEQKQSWNNKLGWRVPEFMEVANWKLSIKNKIHHLQPVTG